MLLLSRSFRLQDNYL